MIKIQIVIGEEGWILEALAQSIYSNISEKYSDTCEVHIARGYPLDGADVYIHFIYLNAKIVSNKRNIVYVTHVDYTIKLWILNKLHMQGAEFIAMSRHTASLIRAAIPLALVHLLIPSSIHFKTVGCFSERLTIGLFFRLYSDKRKNTSLIENLINYVRTNRKSVKLIIYGDGYDKLIQNSDNDCIVYINSVFDRNLYQELMINCHYVTYFGMDEGAVSILDAAALNIPVLATAQGYHLDIKLPAGSMLFDKGEEVLNALYKLIDAPRQTNLENLDRIIEIINYDQLMKNKLNISIFNYVKIPFIKNEFRRKDDFKYTMSILIRKLVGLVFSYSKK